MERPRLATLLPLHHRVLAGLLVVDFCLFAAHIYTGATRERIPPLLNIALDHSIAEWWGYTMVAVAISLLLTAYNRVRIALYLAFAVTIFVVLLDDSLELHEHVGTLVSQASQRFGGNLDQDRGELVAWGLIGASLVPWIVFGAWKTPQAKWHLGYGLALLVAALGFFAVGVDFLQHPFCDAAAGLPYCRQAMDLFEDGGEMMVQTLILAHAAAIFRRSTVP